MGGLPERLLEADDAVRRPLVAYGISHAGAVRQENEDSWYADATTGLALVADGVGGHGGGAAASRIVAESVGRYAERVFNQWTRRARPAIHPSLQEDVGRRAAFYAHRQVCRQPAGHGGSTLVGVWAPRGVGNPATVFHVGDSRAYLFREGELLRLTRDHSLHQQWIDGGRVGTAPNRKYILQALGISERVDPAVQSFVPLAGDAMLLCSDGLSGTFDRSELAQLLRQPLPHAAICRHMIEVALARGVKDNVTAVLCAFDGIGATF